MDESSDSSVLHIPFFSTYLVIGCVILLLQVRYIILIQTSKSLSVLPTYRIMQHNSIACSVNIITQIIAVSFTLKQYTMDHTLNTVNGAIFQGSWAVDYPMILILAANRLLSVMSPLVIYRFCNLKLANVLIVCCWIFGVINATVCLSGQVQNLWDPLVPTFYMTDKTILAQIMHFIDFYFAEFVVVGSLICYILILLVIILKKKARSSVKIEVPLILHFGTNFAMTAIALFLWHHPINDALFAHILNLIVLLRFGISPVLAILTDISVRKQFFRGRCIPTINVMVITGKQTWSSGRSPTKIIH